MKKLDEILNHSFSSLSQAEKEIVIEEFGSEQAFEDYRQFDRFMEDQHTQTNISPKVKKSLDEVFVKTHGISTSSNRIQNLFQSGIVKMAVAASIVLIITVISINYLQINHLKDQLSMIEVQETSKTELVESKEDEAKEYGEESESITEPLGNVMLKGNNSENAIEPNRYLVSVLEVEPERESEVVEETQFAMDIPRTERLAQDEMAREIAAQPSAAMSEQVSKRAISRVPKKRLSEEHPDGVYFPEAKPSFSKNIAKNKERLNLLIAVY